jgi:hypothetical protein
MNGPRDHHFIPAFYLKQWAGPNGKLIEYTRKGGKLIAKSVGPRSTGYERDLYAFPELPPDAAQYLEQVFFAYADQKASDALDNHLGIASVAWTSELTSAWSRFVICLHLRHPDAMPEMRAAVTNMWKNIWQANGADFQAEYEAIRKPTDPQTYAEYVALHDPLVDVKMGVNMIISALDNEIVGAHINQMTDAVIDISASPYRLLTSDRPVQLFNLKGPKGMVSLPISPTKIFVAVNDQAVLVKLRRMPSGEELATLANTYVVSRARRFVWAQNTLQQRFIENRMSNKLEPTPLFPSIMDLDWRKKSSTTALNEAGAAKGCPFRFLRQLRLWHRPTRTPLLGDCTARRHKPVL